MTTPIEKVTPYGEANVGVLENEFPKSGISARATEAIVISGEWTDADYRKIGRAVRTLLAEYSNRYNAATGKTVDWNKIS